MKRYLARQNPKRDENEPEIVRALTDLGVSVYRISGRGIPDLLWGWRGRMGLLEVKGPLGPRGGGPGLNDKEREWWDWWQGPQPAIVRAPWEAIEVVNLAAQTPRDPTYRLASRIGVAINGRNPLELEEAIVDYVVTLQRERDDMLRRVQERLV